MTKPLHFVATSFARIQWPVICIKTCIYVVMVFGQVHGQSPLTSTSPNNSPPTALAPAPTDECGFLRLRPQYISASELSLAVQLAIGDNGTQTALPGQDMVLVAGPPEILQRAVRMLEQVDTPRLQVRLAVHLFDVELNSLKQLGLAAVSQVKARANANALPIESANENLNVEHNQFHVLASQLELNEVLKLLNECSDAKLLADPLLTVVDRQTASFNIVTRIPLGSGAGAERGGQSQSNSIEEAGVKLAITPRVANDATVELRIAPEYSSLLGFSSQGTPVLEVRRAETVVRVAHLQTLVLGGLRKRTNVESAQTVPGMLGLKAVTPVFRTATATVLSESELICIVRPEIVDSPRPSSQELVQQSSFHGKSLQPTVQSVALINTDDTPSLTQMPMRQAPSDLVQSGAYQESEIKPLDEQVTPSAYRPSVYNKPRTQSYGRNINTSRNSVTQPLPFSVRSARR